MKVTKLSRDQLIQLKQTLYVGRADANNWAVSWAEIACIDELVTDEEVFTEYEGIDFTEEDFW